ncbi:MAG: hypothetical protein R3275_07260 [Saprospiraceae bacterium]|nr:hypothetical protein [Saprospiraceae bacterium]
MKQLFLLFLSLAISVNLVSQEEEDSYMMMENVYIWVKPGNQNDFEKAVKAHNEAHHSGAHSARLVKVATGSDVGQYVWQMGPCTFTDLDSRPSDEAHDTDWQENVVPHIKYVSSVEYWRNMPKISHFKEGDDPHDKLSVWLLDIERGEWYRFKAFMEKAVAVSKKMDSTLSAWYNEFNEGDGRDAAIVWRLNGWSDLDNNEWSMSKEYDKMYGEGSWDDAMEEWEEFVKSRSAVIWEILD